MAPIKLEDHIREQFEEREIAPSAGAWDKLEARLDKDQGKKRPLFVWYAIAASIIGIVFISSQFFFSEKATDKQELVEVEAEQVDKDVNSTSETFLSDHQLIDNQTQLANETVTKEAKELAPNKIERVTIKKESAINTFNSQVKTIKPVINNENTVLAVEEKEQASPQKISEVITPEIVINNKVDEVVAVVKTIKLERNTVSVEEIDALLLNAQRELATQRILNETKIDATALLQDIEFELEKSFRDKVFDALGDSFSKIRTAVVERNN